MDSYINMHKEQLLSWSRILDSIQNEVLSWQSQKYWTIWDYEIQFTFSR